MTTIKPSATEFNTWAESKQTLRLIRRLSQVLFLLIWLTLFALTRSPIHEVLRTDLFLISDPLIAICALGAAQLFIPTLLFGILMLVVSVLLGRFFCGWICPLGTLIDGSAKLLKSNPQRFSDKTHLRMLRWKYWILAFVLLAGLMSSQWAFVLDPLVLLSRAMSSSIYPVLSNHLPQPGVPSYLLSERLEIVLLPLLLLIVVLATTALTPRFFCRYLCPLGALYGIVARLPLMKRRVKGCDGCYHLEGGKRCRANCRMQAIANNPHRSRHHECIRCMTGHLVCHNNSIRFQFGFTKKNKQIQGLEIGRRGFLVSSLGGLALAPILSHQTQKKSKTHQPIRPPRVIDENTFLDQCVRCGMCVQACPTNTLQLTTLEAGVAGLWSPVVTPRIAGCRENCNSCSLVCPTEAIPPFSKDIRDKWIVKMGSAVFRKDLCICYTQGLACARCLEICPTNAIESNRVPLFRPSYVDSMRCVGCGLCENACRGVVFGRPAIETFATGRGQLAVLDRIDAS